MTLYAIKINGGHTSFGTVIRTGDITDIVTTKEPERTETKRSIGNTLTTILQIDKYRGTKIEIVPVEGE